MRFRKLNEPRSLPRSGPGVGDAVAAATKAVGVKPCGKCRKRQTAMNNATPGWLRRLFGWFSRP